jgi:hypothetical protein
VTDDDEITATYDWLESLGLARRDELGRRRITQRGDDVGQALHALATWEKAYREAEANRALQ